MNKKAVAILIGSVIVTTALFLLPKWLLEWKQNMTQMSMQNDLAAQLSSSEKMNLMAKLQLLSDEQVQMVHFEIPYEQEQEAKKILLEEISMLHSLGYTGGGITWDELLAEPYSVVSCVIVDADRVLRAYQIEMPSVMVLIDVQTHKILLIASTMASWERAEDALNMTENGVLLSMQTLKAFAKYYGFSVEDALVSDDYRKKENGWAIVSANFVNEEAESVGFGLNFSYQSVWWGSLSDEIMDAERTASEEVWEFDAN